MRMESNSHQELIVVGDRVLVRAESGEDRTQGGLILPASVADKAQVLQGRVVAVGPGVPMPLDDHNEEEPWQASQKQPRYIPMQPEVGDMALFLRKSTVEIQYENEIYLIVPQSGILVLLRDL